MKVRAEDPEERPGRSGIHYVAIGAFWFSLGVLCIKTIGQRLPVMEIVLGRSVFGLVFVYWMARRAGVVAPRGGHGLLVVRGLLGFIPLVSGFYAFSTLPMADAVVLFNTAPVWAAILSLALLRERLGPAGAACAAASLAGVALVARPPFLFGGEGLDPLGAACALNAAFFAGLIFTLIRKISRSEHPLTIVLYFYLVAAPLAVVFSVPGWVTPRGWEWALLVALGYCTQAGQLNLTKGLALVSAGKAAAGNTLQIVFAGLWGAIFFSEIPPWLSVLGAAIIIASTVALGRLKERPVAPEA
jgi:drug/metabolite transporter (DMT)-like permease